MLLDQIVQRSIIAARGRVGYLRGVYGSQSRDGSRLIGGLARPEQTRDRDGSNDEDNCHDDQEFQQRKTFTIPQFNSSMIQSQRMTNIAHAKLQERTHHLCREKILKYT